MLRTYLKLSARTLRRRLGYTAINTVGLTLGLACLMVVALYLHHETTYDTHHEDADRTYRLVQEVQSGAYAKVGFITTDRPRDENTGLVPPHLRDRVPEIEQATQFVHSNADVFMRAENRRTVLDEMLFTDNGGAFFDVFTFDFVAGTPASALNAPSTVVLTMSAAERLFGDVAPSDLVGRVVDVEDGEAPTPLTVQAIVADPPSTSHFNFEAAIRPAGPLPSWGAHTYVRLTEGARPDAVSAKIQDAFLALGPRNARPPNLVGFDLQRITDIHLDAPVLRSTGVSLDARYLWAFGLVAGLVLVITVINYANLSVALYAERRGEVGVRKAMGARRGQVAQQFLVEAVLLALGGGVMAIGVVEMVLPAFNNLMGVPLANAFARTPGGLALALATAAGIGLLAGLYPAWRLARQDVIELFDDAFSGGSSWSLRHGLITVQLVLLVALGSLTVLVQQQLTLLQTADTGLPKSGVVEVQGLDDADDFVRLRNLLASAPEIEAVGTGPLPSRRDGAFGYRLAGDDVVREGAAYIWADLGWFDVMGIDVPLLDRLRERPDADTTYAVVNQTLASRVPSLESGSTLYMEATADNEGYPFVLSGIVPDVRLGSLHSPQQPAFYRLHDARPAWVYNAVVRFDTRQTTSAMNRLETAWSTLRPNEPLKTDFLSDRLASLYAQERQFGVLSTILTGLAIGLAALGLAGLSAFVARRRRKEIGIRKALGATLSSLVVLLNREIVLLVGVALALATPVAWWAAHAWLQSFATRIDVSPLVFVGVGTAALVLVLLATSVQTLRAARVDPAHVLRSE